MAARWKKPHCLPPSAPQDYFSLAEMGLEYYRYSILPFSLGRACQKTQRRVGRPSLRSRKSPPIVE